MGVKEEMKGVLVVQNGRSFTVDLAAELEQRKWRDRGLCSVTFGAGACEVEVSSGCKSLDIDLEAQLGGEGEEG